MPPAVPAANARTSTPNRSNPLRTPAVAPLMAKAKVPMKSMAVTKPEVMDVRRWDRGILASSAFE